MVHELFPVRAAGFQRHVWFGSGVDTTPLATDYGDHPGESSQIKWAVDNVQIQGATAPNFTFMLAYVEAEIISNMPGIDGVLGLSLAGGTQLKIEDGGAAPQSLPYALQQAGLLENDVFGMYMPSGQITGDQLTLGGVDETKFEGDLTWVSLNRTYAPYPKPQWNVNMQTIFINNQQLESPSTSPTDATVPFPQSLISILDIGFPTIIAPDLAAARTLYAPISPKIYQIDPNGAWGCPCAEMDAIIASGPDITFLLGFDDNGEQQLNVTIPSSVFNLGPYPGLDGICQAPVNHWSGGAFGPGGIGLWSIGSVLLKNYYTAWDGEGLQVGFAPLKGAEQWAVSSGVYKAPSESNSLGQKGGREIMEERPLEQANVGLGGALMMVE